MSQPREKERNRKMATNNSRLAYHKIKRLEVAGGFLDGMKIEFDDNLNRLIVGRGTSKTTEIEFTRYAPFEIERCGDF